MVTWRPGSGSGSELRAAILQGPGATPDRVWLQCRSPFHGSMTEEVSISVLDNELAQDPKLFKELAATSPQDFLQIMHSRLREMQKIKKEMEETR